MITTSVQNFDNSKLRSSELIKEKTPLIDCFKLFRLLTADIQIQQEKPSFIPIHLTFPHNTEAIVTIININSHSLKIPLFTSTSNMFCYHYFPNWSWQCSCIHCLLLQPWSMVDHQKERIGDQYWAWDEEINNKGGWIEEEDNSIQTLTCISWAR